MTEPCNCEQSLALTAEVTRLRDGVSHALYWLHTAEVPPSAETVDDVIKTLERIVGPPDGHYRCPRCGKIEVG